jgi:hypothetical protein
MMTEPSLELIRHPGFDVVEKRLATLRPIELVAEDREAERAQVHAELVLASGLRGERNQGRIFPTRDDAVAGHRRVTLSSRRHLHQEVQPLFRTVQRKVDAAFVLGHDAPHDGEVPLGHPAVFEADLEVALGRPRTAANHQAAGLAVQPMSDLRRIVSEALAQQMGEGLLVVRRRGVHRKPRGLVDRDDGVVLIHDVEVERDLGLGQRRTHQHHGLARTNPLARSAARPIGAISAGTDDLLCPRARKPRDPILNEPVETLAGLLGRDRKRQDDRSRIAAWG